MVFIIYCRLYIVLLGFINVLQYNGIVVFIDCIVVGSIYCSSIVYCSIFIGILDSMVYWMLWGQYDLLGFITLWYLLYYFIMVYYVLWMYMYYSMIVWMYLLYCGIIGIYYIVVQIYYWII